MPWVSVNEADLARAVSWRSSLPFRSTATSRCTDTLIVSSLCTGNKIEATKKAKKESASDKRKARKDRMARKKAGLDSGDELDL